MNITGQSSISSSKCATQPNPLGTGRLWSSVQGHSDFKVCVEKKANPVYKERCTDGSESCSHWHHAERRPMSEIPKSGDSRNKIISKISFILLFSFRETRPSLLVLRCRSKNVRKNEHTWSNYLLCERNWHILSLCLSFILCISPWLCVLKAGDTWHYDPWYWWV